ncbi:hypothetical protein EHF33_09570 [Deinococcus psychrotolerans]|uniref:Uncharacterized protein n=1 Tax=Deinococcus psychrotolerans TaxID=2489213 RepID=A0A3G8YDN2_9DEIO|nr:hypothetical protein [Deinococcus psychrotolerans]AZI42960.1 hypothetical protein EHF33_09570 [Deinococcus psychrotolerans]
MPYRQAVAQLGDLISARALERLIESAAQDRSMRPEELSSTQLADILKRDVFRRLQLTVPASLAKRRIEEVLANLKLSAAVSPAPSNAVTRIEPPSQSQLDGAAQAPEPQQSGAQPNAAQAQNQLHVASLEESLKAYSLYFDWPEVKRLRALSAVLRGELDAGKPLPDKLVAEGLDLQEALSRRLAEALVRQESDLAELRAGFGRVEGVGGPKVRRLSGLLQSIEDAQKTGALLPSEVERARNLTLDLRKLVASSVVGLPTGGAAPQASDDVVQQVRELDRAHEVRALSDLSREFAPLMRVEEGLNLEIQAAKERLDSGHLLGEERFVRLRSDLEAAQLAQLAQQQTELSDFETRLSQLDSALRPAEQAQLGAAVARGLLSSGSLATDELRLLSRSLPLLESGDASAEDALENQRELLEIEQAARDLPVIEGLQGDLSQAAQALERGEMADLSALWAVIDQRKGVAAQEREALDLRTRQVLDEYGRYRHLAGDTISHLGRLADTLRSHLKLGKLSADGRAHYMQVLGDAEALLSEARAEFQVARDLTAQFGEEALTGLLDALGLDEEPEQELVTLPPLPQGLWELRGGTVMRGAPDPQAWSLARLSAQLAELPLPIGDAEVRLDTPQGVWLLLPHLGGHRAAQGADIEEARARMSDFPE